MIIRINKDPKKNENIDLKTINHAIEDTIDQTEQLEELIKQAPGIFDGYENFRRILRAIKRGEKVEDAVESYCNFACPPSEKNEECDMACDKCWKNYLIRYLKVIKD